MIKIYKKQILASLGLVLLLVTAALFTDLRITKPARSGQAQQNSSTGDAADSNFGQEASTTLAAAALVKEQGANPPAGKGSADPAVPIAPASASGVAVDPIALRISAIKLEAPIIRTGLEADGSLHVPGSPDLTGWYEQGPRPGEVGSSVITGHYDSKSGPGVFFNLKMVKPGDAIEIVRSDGSVAVFKVERSALYSQEDFPTELVYDSVQSAGLRIITCAGTYNKATGYYSDNLVVYANLLQIRQPGPYAPL